MTETSPGATSLPYRKAREHGGSAGLAHFFTDIRVVDVDGTPLAAGQDGEIEISGPNVSTEYWLRPDATRDSHHGEWFRSGDIGRLDEDGYLTISDRLKDLIISGGENIYPAEVEQLIMELPEIASVAVIGVPDARWGEVPFAIAVARGEITPDAVLAHLAGRIAKYKIPRTVVFVEDLPRTASGKVRKTDLRERYIPRTDEPR